MTVAKGAVAEPIRILSVRDLTAADLEKLRAPRHTPSRLAKIRDSHHALARALVSGCSYDVAAEMTGYSISRIALLKNDPAFQQLMADYRTQIHEVFLANQDEYLKLLTSNQMRAERMISDKLDDAEEEETLPEYRTLLAIARDAADRTGYGKHTTQTNVNVDFASKLEAMVRRSGVTIEGASAPSSMPATERRALPTHSFSPTPSSQSQDVIPRRRVA